MATRRWWRALQVLLAVVLVGGAAHRLAGNWALFRTQRLTLHLSVPWLLLSCLIVLATFGMLIEAWRRVVLSQGESLAPLSAARIWLLASLGKYIPGKVWAIAGAAVMAEQAGVRRGVAVTAALVLQALALGSGVIVVGVTAPGALSHGGRGLVLAAMVLGGLALVGVAALCSGRALRAIGDRMPASWPRFEPLRPAVAIGGLLANALAWVAYGVAFVCLARGLTPDAVPPLALAIAVFTASYLVGLIALLAPAGVGPRESLFILLLSEPLGLKAAVGLAVASRILLTVTELGAALPFLLWRRAAPVPNLKD